MVTMGTKRKVHTPAFKAQVALAAVRGDRMVNELAAQFGVHPTLIHAWKKHLLAGAEQVFATGAKPTHPGEDRTPELYEPIGRLKVELDWVKKKRRRSADDLRRLVEPGHPELSVRRQCELLGLNRSTAYYRPAAETPDNLRLMELIDRQFTARPFYGSRRMTAWLRSQGHGVNRKRVQRLLGVMGLEAIHPRPKRRGDGQPHRVFPYLLRGVVVERPDQVWSADIPYLPVVGGFMYLAATIDWFSRLVVAWRLSNTLDGSFCRAMLDEALDRGTPEVFNTDQGGPVHRPGVDRPAGGGGHPGEHGRAGAGGGQRARRAAVAIGEVRGRVPAGVRVGPGPGAGPGGVLRLLQP